jgi:hypothetical protein
MKKQKHIRQFILSLFALLASNYLIAQCNCEKIKREDGVTVTVCPPTPVASDNSTEIGLSVQSNVENNFLAVTIRFKGTAKNVIGKTTIRLNDNNLFSLELVNSDLSYVGNSQVANAVFLLTTESKVLLKKSNIQTISFSLSDNLRHIYELKMNSDIVKKQLPCL